MRLAKRSGRGQWLSMGVIVGLLLGVSVQSWGAECTPGAGRYNGNALYPYMGNVPLSAIPPDKPTQSCDHYNVTLVENCGASNCCQGGSYPGGWINASQWGITIHHPAWCPNYESPIIFEFSCSSTNGDYDCDGILDNSDPNPMTPDCTDTDADGYCDSGDPFPTDGSCPGNASNWIRDVTMTAKDGTCTFQYYKTSDGSCPGFYTASGTDCTGKNPDVDPSNWSVYVDPNGEQNFCEWEPSYCETWPPPDPPGPGPGPSPGPQPPAPGDQTQELELLRDIRTYTSGSDSDLTTIVGNTGAGGSINGTLGEISGKLTTLNNKEWSPTVNMDTSGITSRQEVQTGVLNDIKNKTIPLGEGSLPDADLGSVEDNSSVGEESNTATLDSEQGILSDFLDSWWGNNPIKSIVDGSGIEASGSASFTLNAGFGSTEVDLSGLGGGLSDLGLMLVGLSTLAGIIVVLRD